MISAKDLTTALASLSKAKGYIATVVLTLGITLGALVTMFNLNYQLLAAPLPYPDQERLYISRGNSYIDGELNLQKMTPYPGLIEIYNSSDDFFEQKALVSFGLDLIRSLPDSPRVNTSYITPDYLQLLQVPMALGRVFNADEGLEAHSPVAILSYSSWQRLFKGDPDILDKSLRFGEVDFRIVGVTGEHFVEPQLAGAGRLTQVWLPWDYNTASAFIRKSWGNFSLNLHLVGKLKPEVWPVQVQQELTSRVNGRFKEENAGKPFFDNMSIDLQLVSYRQAILGDSKSRTLLLLAGVLALVLIAAANITNLILSRAANQHRTMAIQAALGAQKTHLFNGVFAEILLLMAMASLLALAVAFGGVELLKLLAYEQLPHLQELSLNWRSLGFSLVSAFLLSLAFSLLVSHQIDYRALHGTLQSSGKGSGIQISARVRKLLILSQVALTGILLAASLHILQQSLRHIAQPLGFASDDIYYASLIGGTQQDTPDTERRNNLLAIRKQLQDHPKIEMVSIAIGIPIHSSGDGQWQSYLSADADFKRQKQAATSVVDENYLDILRLELVSGRYFTAEEVQQKAKVVIINETFARNLQADGKVMGQRFYWFNSSDKKKPYEVVGIVRDLTLPGRAEEPRMFVPLLETRYPLWLLKLKPQQQLSSAELNQLMVHINSQYKVFELLSLTRAHQLLLARDTLSAGITAALALLALGLAAIGIYGVLSYSVLIRRFELGIRMAIGARPVTVFLQVLKDNLAPVIIGLVLALAALAGLWLWIQQSTYNLQTSVLGWVLPELLILGLTAATTLLAVWKIISRPAIGALRDD